MYFKPISTISKSEFPVQVIRRVFASPADNFDGELFSRRTFGMVYTFREDRQRKEHKSETGFSVFTMVSREFDSGSSSGGRTDRSRGSDPGGYRFAGTEKKFLKKSYASRLRYARKYERKKRERKKQKNRKIRMTKRKRVGSHCAVYRAGGFAV